ncbi:MAG: zf-HC2 domain-containing protein [Lachnospiraceae bacterium]|nr:zf-HC2 domain-containing protein [Lachnospiraceae bacterium]
MEYIDCDVCEQNMNAFIENKLVGEHLWQFLTHVESCPDCYEELEIKYLIAEALGRLENGEAINLKDELAQKIKLTKRAMYFHYFNEDVLRILEIVSMIIIVYEVFGFLSHFFGIVF